MSVSEGKPDHPAVMKALHRYEAQRTETTTAAEPSALIQGVQERHRNMIHFIYMEAQERYEDKSNNNTAWKEGFESVSRTNRNDLDV